MIMCNYKKIILTYENICIINSYKVIIFLYYIRYTALIYYIRAEINTALVQTYCHLVVQLRTTAHKALINKAHTV